MAYTQKNNPFPVTSCGRRRSYMVTDNPVKFHNESPMKNKQLEKVVDELHNASRMHKAQAKTIDKHIDDMEDSPVKKRKKSNEPRKTTKGKGRNYRTTKEGAGMTSKGVKEYRRKNPGSKLKTAVTGKVKPGSKAAKRRKSFCARSKGWTGERGKAARRRWKC
tara:strand:+ start:111 stop:599 length:489 start_codon:yes stop_codon:yes gene_type:complete